LSIIFLSPWPDADPYHATQVVSVQVLNETVAVARRKMNLSWSETDELLRLIKASCKVVPLTVEAHELAVEIAQRHQLSIYDAMICASAAEAGAATLWTEDLNNGQIIAGVRVSNPFA
jgi:predicted nucleic acid-binding protein